MKKNIFIILGIILVVVIVERLISSTSFFEDLELETYNWRAKLTSDTTLFDGNFYNADKDIVIVAVDDYSKNELKKAEKTVGALSDWHRDRWIDVLDFVEKGEPKTVLFDFVFADVSENSWYDRRLAQDLRRYNNVVLGTYLDSPKIKDDNFSNIIEIEPNNNIPAPKSLDVVIKDKKLDDNITYYTHSPIHNIYSKFNEIGVVNRIVDKDSRIRKTRPIYKLEKDGAVYYLPSLSFAGFLAYMGEEEPIRVENRKIIYKGREIPLDDEGTLNLNWRKSKNSYSYIPVSKILLNQGGEDEIKPEFFKDKLVIIGQTTSGKSIELESFVPSKYTRPESIALALDNLINDTYVKDESHKNFTKEIPAFSQFIITVFACALVAFICMVSQSAFVGCLNGIFLIVLYVILCFWLFTNPASRVWVPIVVPLYYLSITSALVSAYRFHREITKKASIMNVFGKFVSPKILSTVIKNPEKLVLKNTKKRITTLFCDVKDFSKIAEKYDAEKLIDNLNEVFKEIVNVIFENNGTVDKFIGDCVMAYWGDFSNGDNDAYLAVKTALEIRKRIDELKVKNALAGKIIFDVKIGINTGEAILGITGTDKIMSYTAMGDAVNIASRLEKACSSMDRKILISKATYDEAKGKIVALDAGEIAVKGKNKLIEVFEPIALADDSEENLG